jgi:hypothetical protein
MAAYGRIWTKNQGDYRCLHTCYFFSRRICRLACIFLRLLWPLPAVLWDGEHAVQLVLCDNWLREYQVLPNRTHPLVNMSCSGGYLLSGIKVHSDRPFGAPVPRPSPADVSEAPPAKVARLA